MPQSPEIKTSLQIVIDRVNKLSQKLEDETREAVIRILQANLDENLQPLPRARDGSVVARLAGNIINHRSFSPKITLENLLIVRGGFSRNNQGRSFFK